MVLKPLILERSTTCHFLEHSYIFYCGGQRPISQILKRNYVLYSFGLQCTVFTRTALVLTIANGVTSFLTEYSYLIDNSSYTIESRVLTLISVRSCNFNYGGSLKARFLAKNQHATTEKSLKKSYE